MSETNQASTERSVNRRKFLKASAATVATGSAAGAAAAFAPSPARALWREYCRSEYEFGEASCRADSARCDAEREAEELWSSWSPVYSQRKSEGLKLMGIKLTKGNFLHPTEKEWIPILDTPSPENESAVAEAIQAERNAEIERRNEPVYRRHHVEELQAAFEAAEAHTDAVREKILSLKDGSHEALLVKLAVWACGMYEPGYLDCYEVGAGAAYDDLVEITGFDPVAEFRAYSREGVA